VAQKKEESREKVLHNSYNNRNNQSPLIVPNEYGSNLNLLDEVGGYEEFLRFYQDTGLDLAQVLAEGPSASEVDPYKKFELGRSLYNLEKLGELGTQMYLLNRWYMSALKGDKLSPCQN
jgi:hypothetical protein